MTTKRTPRCCVLCTWDDYDLSQEPVLKPSYCLKVPHMGKCRGGISSMSWSQARAVLDKLVFVGDLGVE